MTRRFTNIIGGAPVDSPSTFLARNSSNLEDVIGEFPEATREQVREACATARRAFAEWGRTPAPIRGQIIGSIGKAIEREKEALSRLVSREMGKTLKEARGDVQEAIDTCHFFQSEGRRLYGQTVPSEMPRKELMTYRRPLGVVGIITAGNCSVRTVRWRRRRTIRSRPANPRRSSGSPPARSARRWAAPSPRCPPGPARYSCWHAFRTCPTSRSPRAWAWAGARWNAAWPRR